jgi:hypothetical protein
MKNRRFTSILNSNFIACALMIGSLASIPYASAQSKTALAEVNIPFTFQARARTMPAGTYQIDRESGYLILLRGPNHATEFVMMHGASKSHAAADHGYIVFDRYGDKYFLRQIWTVGDAYGLECSKSRAEKEALQAMNRQPPDAVELAFNAIPQH